MARKKFSTAFAEVVRKHRQRIGLSQEALAEKADIHRTYVGMLERGERAATLDTALKLAEALDIPLYTLVAEAQAEWVPRQMPVPPRKRS